ncbi:hypothetical protein ASPCAL05997 [Aspergillus calidoustus]|uniref:Uncharacterized protein n=1 Tax=Aspergillus calidoustus TaxID=454130 RepID=A0A0U5C8D4_ASPCI|nr:hypothetical protein ASPCAL05997 [Aspergillus calidoustus]
MSTHVNNIEINMNADSQAVSLSQNIGSINVSNTIPESITQLPDALMEDFDKAMAWFAQNEQAMQDLDIPEYTGPQMPGVQAFMDAKASKTTGMVETAAPTTGGPLITYDMTTGTHWLGNTAEGEILVNRMSSLPPATNVDMQQAPSTDQFSNIGVAIAGAGTTDSVGVMASNMHAFWQDRLVDVPTPDPNRNVQVFMQKGFVVGTAIPGDANQTMNIDVFPTSQTQGAAMPPVDNPTWQQNNTGNFQPLQTTVEPSVSTSPASTATTETSTASSAATEFSEDSDSDMELGDSDSANAERTIRFLPPLLPEHMENGLYEQLLQHEHDVAVTERELNNARTEANQVVEYVQGELATAQGEVAQLREEQAQLARELRDAKDTLTRATMDRLRKERDMLDRTLADLERFQAQARELEEVQEKARVLEAEKNALQARLGSR